MLEIKNNSNLLNKAFEKFLKTKDANEFCNQIGIWIFGYVSRRLKATEDEASMVFLDFWMNKAKLIDYLNKRGCRNIFGFLTYFSKNLFWKVKKQERSQESIQEFFISLEKENQKNSTSPTNNVSQILLKSSIQKLSILNRIIFCLRYGILLGKGEKIFLVDFLGNQEKYSNLMREFEKRVKQQQKKSNQQLEKLNFYHWKILYSHEKYHDLFCERKKKTQENLLKLQEIFTIKELAQLLGISKYRATQSCEHSLKFIRKDLHLLNQAQFQDSNKELMID
jgi:hypothetical protein